MSQKPAIALVAATYKRPDALAMMFGSLARQTAARAAFEAVVVVDGRDETEGAYREVLEAAAGAGLPLSWEFQDNAGPAKARNRAIRGTGAPFVVIVDDDMDLAPRFLEAHLAALGGVEDRRVSIGRVVPEEGWDRQPLYEAVRTKAMLELHDGIAAGQRRAQASAFVTQNVALSRALFDEVGGLDEHLRLGEDTELGYRLELAGARFVFADDASAIHRSRVGSYETWLRRQVQYGRNVVYIHEKLGREPRTHPLRNLVNGSRLNSAAVHALCWSDRLAHGGIEGLRRVGDGLHRVGLRDPAIATHKAILAIAYHLGVKHALGSWWRVLQEKRAFAAHPARPPDPT